ncbi:unnamed protein product [Caenorhabditis angaria]|uniref:Uncharacterized protein n=1 Tax=Caenorhabditis angaria TaxID=860376 RepID=A0A9P1I7H4_9PELO|nr:unnamed protein product [Caenorhabditis angaria]
MRCFDAIVASKITEIESDATFAALPITKCVSDENGYVIGRKACTDNCGHTDVSCPIKAWRFLMIFVKKIFTLQILNCNNVTKFMSFDVWFSMKNLH